MKILYFYPENPLLLTQGNNARANKLLEYFKTRNIEVDFVGEETREFTIQDSNELVKTNLVNMNTYNQVCFKIYMLMLNILI